MLNNDFDILLFYGNNRILYIHHRYNQQIILEKEILYGIRKKKIFNQNYNSFFWYFNNKLLNLQSKTKEYV